VLEVRWYLVGKSKGILYFPDTCRIGTYGGPLCTVRRFLCIIPPTRVQYLYTSTRYWEQTSPNTSAWSLADESLADTFFTIPPEASGTDNILSVSPKTDGTGHILC
jgi:hypothetical protein